MIRTKPGAKVRSPTVCATSLDAGTHRPEREGSYDMENHLKRMLKERKVAVGVQLRLGSPAIAEMFAWVGFDFVVLDCEHAPQSPIGIQAQLQAIGAARTTALVRLPANDPDLMRVYLDMGALGIVAPFVNEAKEAALGAGGLRYPPRGTRGFGPGRAARYGLEADYLGQADDNMIYVPVIEDARAIDNIDEILAVDGVDTFAVGPCDLGISLGVGLDFADKKFVDAVNRVLKAAEYAKKPPGIHVYGDFQRPETLKRFIDMGFKLLLAGGDEWILARGCKGLMDTVDRAKGI